MLMMAKMHTLAVGSGERVATAEFRSATVDQSVATSRSISAPTGQLAGDMLLLVIGSQAANVNVNSLPGWTNITSAVTANESFHVFYKLATSDNESADLTVSSSNNKTVFYAAFSGATGIDAGSRDTASGVPGITVSAVTATAPGCRVVAGFCDSFSATVSSGPTDFTEVDTDLGTTLWYLEGEPAGTSPTASLTWSANNTKYGIQLQIH